MTLRVHSTQVIARNTDMRLMRCFVAMAAAVLLVTPSLAKPDHPNLSYFLVKEILGYFPAINNNGEIVYAEASAVGSNADTIVSTHRGALAGPSANLRFPDINDAGEVVYTDFESSVGLGVFSTERGFLGLGNFPGINDLGAVSAEVPGRVLLYEPDGTLSQIQLSFGQEVTSTNVSNSGEITYVVRVETGPRLTGNVISSTRGPLTNFTTGDGALGHAANNLGQFIYTALGDDGDLHLFDQDGRSLWDGTVGAWADINDYGDIVFNIPVQYEIAGTTSTQFAIILGTSRPKFFQSEFKRIPASNYQKRTHRL